jgi:hypothetical protein
MHTLAVDTWGASCGEATFTSLIAAIKVDVFEVEGVNVPRNVSV